MNEELDFIIEEARERMDGAISFFEKELVKIRAGKASPVMVSGVRVDYYGTPTPIDKVANIHTPDARTITIQPWEKKLLGEIDKAILASNLGFTPANNGEMLIINLPPLTEDRRRELARQAKAEMENAKVNVRNIRKDSNNEIRRTENVSEDMMKSYEAQIQEITDDYIKKIEAIHAEKEKDIMTVS